MRRSLPEDTGAGTGHAERLFERGAFRGLLTGLALAFGILFLIVGALVWTMPAQSLARLVDLPPQVRGLHGHLRAGGATLAGGFQLDWTLEPSSVLGGRLGATTRLSGPNTEMTAEIAMGLGGVAVQDLRGRAGASLLQLASGADLTCDSRATLDVNALRFGGGRAAADGLIDIVEGTCRAGGQSMSLPATRVTLGTEGDDALAIARTAAGTQIGSARITGDRRAVLRLEPEGAAMIPGLPDSAATMLELPF